MISVIIPTFKRKEMLFFEIDKLYKQKGCQLEIIVINDDIPNDPTDEITTKYPDVVYIKHPTKIGPGQKRQVGFAIAKGEYICTPDDDDFLIDDHFFEKAISIMENDKSISFVSGNSSFYYEEENDISKKVIKYELNVKGKYAGIDYLENMQGKYMKPLSSFPTVFRKEALEQQKFLNQIEMSDVSLYMLASLGGNVYFIEDYVGMYRVHTRSLTKKKSSSKWINGVLRQKEYFLTQIKTQIANPEAWWLRHIKLSYFFYANTSKSRNEKLKLLSWCIMHSHGYINVLKFSLKEIINVIKSNK